MSAVAGCELCDPARRGLWHVVARHPAYDVLRVTDAPDFPAFYRVIWRDHAAELSDLSPAERATCLDAVIAVERALRRLSPDKINLASLGNMVPHLHWHVVARFRWDSHFPQPIWGTRQREPGDAAGRLALGLPALDEAVRAELAAMSAGSVA